MRTLVIFDSQYGNTEKIARCIGSVLQQQGEVQIVRVAGGKDRYAHRAWSACSGLTNPAVQSDGRHADFIEKHAKKWFERYSSCSV